MLNFRLIRHLYLFLTVAEELHFGRAAKRLGMSQPPLSEQIKILESSLHAQLFNRTTRGVQLTPVGVAILPAVRRFVDRLNELESAVRESVDGRTGTLTIGAITSSMFECLPPILKRLKDSHPKISIFIREIDSVEAVPALESGDIDFAFARLEGALGPSIASIPMREEQLAVALPDSHPLAACDRVPLALLAQEDFVMFSRRFSPLYFDWVISACRAKGFSPRILHEVRSVVAQVAFVSCGQGVALVPDGLEKVAPDNVVVRPLTDSLRVVTTAMAWSVASRNVLVQSALTELGVTADGAMAVVSA